MSTLFEKIIARDIPADIVYEDNTCICFRDIEPKAPTHLLLVPKKVITGIGAAQTEDANILGHLMSTIPHIAALEGFAENGFRVVINHGADGGQTVDHLHLHLLAGRSLTWPPG